MATFYSNEYSKTFETPIARKMDSTYEGNVKFIKDTYTVTAALLQNQEIEFGTIPAGAHVLDVAVISTDLHAGAGSPTLDVGYTGATDAFISGADVTGPVATRYAATNAGIAFTEAKQLVAKIMDAATDATSGSIKIICTYVLD